MPQLLSVSLGSLIGSLIGTFVARWLYEHYFRWRVERLAMLSHETELAALRLRLACQLRTLGAEQLRSLGGRSQ